MNIRQKFHLPEVIYEAQCLYILAVSYKVEKNAVCGCHVCFSACL
jgi:hypothetical protein